MGANRVFADDTINRANELVIAKKYDILNLFNSALINPEYLEELFMQIRNLDLNNEADVKFLMLVIIYPPF
jgi:hypothetical protein